MVRSHDQNGPPRALQHATGDAAEDEAGQATAPVRGHGDQVHVLPASIIHDLLDGLAEGDDALRLDARLPEWPRLLRQVLLQLLLHALLGLLFGLALAP